MEELAQSCCWGAQPRVRKSNIICFLKLPSPSSSRAGESPTAGMLAGASQGKQRDSSGTGQRLLQASLAVLRDHAPPEQGRKERTQLLKAPLQAAFASMDPAIPLQNQGATTGRCQSKGALGHLCPSRAGAPSSCPDTRQTERGAE